LLRGHRLLLCISSFIGAEGHLKLAPFPTPFGPRGRPVADEFSPGPLPVNSNVIDAR